MKVSILLLLNLLIFTTCSLIEDKSVISISLKGDLNISSYLNTFVQLNNEHVDKRSIENARDSDYNYAASSFTTVSHSSFVMPKTVGSYLEPLDFTLESIKLNNKTLALNNDYSLTIDYPDNLVSPNPKLFNYTLGDKQSYFDMKIHQPSLSTQLKTLTIEEMNYVVSFKNIVLGIDKNSNKLKAFALVGQTIQTVDLNKLLDQTANVASKEIKKIILESNNSHEHNHILMIDSNSVVYILKINSNNTAVSLSLENQFEEKTENVLEIVDFVVKNSMFYFGYKKSIVVRDSKKKVNELELIYNSHSEVDVEFNLIDIHEVGKVILVLVENYGIKMLNVENPSSIFWSDFDFYHPFVRKIETYNNPYHDFPFLAVLIENNKKVKEFFIEFSLRDETKPLLYRYYLSDKNFDINFIVSDEEFTYLFERNSNSVYVLSKSITANEKNSIYKIQINDLSNSEVIYSPFLITDENFITSHLGIVSNNKFALMKKIEIKNAEFELVFNEPGSYEFEFFTYSDFCKLNIEKVKMCKNYLTFKMDVAKYEKSYKNSIFEYLFVFISLLLIILFLVLIAVCIFRLDKIKSFIRNRDYQEFGSDNKLNISKNRKDTVVDTPESNRKITDNEDVKQDVEV